MPRWMCIGCPATSARCDVCFLALLSSDAQQQFPFCVASLSITRIALEALREKKLNKLANSLNDVVLAEQEFFSGCYLHLFREWCVVVNCVFVPNIFFEGKERVTQFGTLDKCSHLWPSGANRTFPMLWGSQCISATRWRFVLSMML